MTRATTIVPRYVADGAFVWALLVLTVPQLTFLQMDISRTREIMTVYLLVGLSVVGRWWRNGNRRVVAAVWLLGVMSVFGLISWSRALDWDRGLNFWAEWLLMSAGLMFGLGFARWRWPVWRRIIVGYAVVLSLIQLLALAVISARGVEAGPDPAFYEMRPLTAALATFLVVAMVLAAFADDLTRRTRVILVALLGISVVLSQNRSAWAALIVALALSGLAMWRHPDRRTASAGIASVAGFMLLSLVLPVMTGLSVLPGTGGAESRELPESATSTITTAWRLEMWESRLSASRSLGEWLFGGVFGLTPAKGPTSQVMNPLISAHNLALDVVTMIGIVGLLAVAFLVFTACFGTGQRLAALPICIWSLLALGVFYNWPAWAWLVLGAALAQPSRAVTALVGEQDVPAARVAG